MKVYLELPKTNENSRGLLRVYDALIKYAPKEIEITKYFHEAELHIIHAIGRYDRLLGRIAELKENNRRYAMIQYCIRSTQKPDARDWLLLWENAELVWSYYDLPELLKEDTEYEVGFKIGQGQEYFNFYHAPLGVDSEVFKEFDLDRHFVVATHGHHALTQSIKECVVAAKRAKRDVFHLGHQLRRGDDITCKSGISDLELASYYSQCEFVSGLRRIEGFEMPVIEGLLCGAKPIVFDQPHYRKWFDGLAMFIPEKSREEVTDLLEIMFKCGTKPVTQKDKENAKMLFNWERIIGGFWERLLK
jgi:hypothetical protein|tara:strand:- start:1978 stop:2889 length:912 start_codon:yes stop_codon:yes gene_type:complete